MPICKKIKHASMQAALNHIREMKKKYPGEYGAYYHAACNAYHITRKIKGNGKFVKFKG